jgi:hypothetical protein
VHALVRRRDLLDGDEAKVELGRVAGGQRRRPPLAAAADNERNRRLHRLGQRRGLLELVVVALEREGLAGRRRPQAGDDRELFLEQVEPARREGDAVGLVLPLEPAGTEPELGAAAGHRVDLRHRDREDARQPERHRAH